MAGPGGRPGGWPRGLEIPRPGSHPGPCPVDRHPSSAPSLAFHTFSPRPLTSLNCDGFSIAYIPMDDPALMRSDERIGHLLDQTQAIPHGQRAAPKALAEIVS